MRRLNQNSHKPDLGIRDYLKGLSQSLEIPELKKEELEISRQIEEKAEQLITENFASVDRSIDQLRSSVKRSNTLTGETFEDWSLVTGQDLESVIFEIEKAVSEIGPEVTKQYMRAHFTHFIWDDEYWENYRKPLDGTRGDREAYAKRYSRESRYQYLFQYWFWEILKERLEYYKQVQRDFRWAIERRINDRSGVYGE